MNDARELAEPKPDAVAQVPPPSSYAQGGNDALPPRPAYSPTLFSQPPSGGAAWMTHAAEIEAANKIADLAAQRVALSVTSLIIPERAVAEGTLIRSVSAPWHEIVKQLGSNWRLAYEIPPAKWEEIIAGGFKKAGYDEVTLTPRSGDHGRDVIAIKRGFGCVKILGSVKAYAPGNLVPYDAVRALVGVLAGERDASKGIITTTSDFPPRISHDPNIAPFIPTRLELVNGTDLQQWLIDLAKGGR